MPFLQNIFKRKKLIKIELGKVGLIVSTEASIEAGINNKFNKKIVIYVMASVHGDADNPIVKWGKIIEEIPYTEEEVINLMKIKQIPIVEKKLKNKFEFKSGIPFGEYIQ